MKEIIQTFSKMIEFAPIESSEKKIEKKIEKIKSIVPDKAFLIGIQFYKVKRLPPSEIYRIDLISKDYLYSEIQKLPEFSSASIAIIYYKQFNQAT